MFKVLLVIMLVLNLIGCATINRGTKVTDVQQLQVKVGELEEELQKKDQEIGYLENQLEKIKNKKAVSSTSGTSQKTPKNIQIALKNAGLYNGPIDGKIGEKTKSAILEFQKKNDLTADGIVGKATWAKLKKNLE